MQNSTLGVITSGLCLGFTCVSREFSPWNDLTPGTTMFSSSIHWFAPAA